MAKADRPRSFQEILLRLSQYWAGKGCAMLQPYDMEVGAGTFHPATTMRALGPVPWTAAYVQPSRRPTDGRYGDSPNRWQHYYQYQVIIKPSPKDLQALYLGSLEAIGIDMDLHDIRFVEDDWESPTLGAWGLGWEVWCDGMEVSQFTYFQQVGGHDCHPVSGELTYGLERLAMYILGYDDGNLMPWNDPDADIPLTYGDVFREAEAQYARWNFDVANTEMLKTHFEDAEAECRAILEQPAEDPRTGRTIVMALPAYDQCIKASHLFNLLDARGGDLGHRAAGLYRAGAGAGQGLRGCVCADRGGRCRLRMRSGQLLVIGIIAATTLFGAGVWYSQTRAWYVQFEEADVVAMRFDGEIEPLLVTGFEGIDADTSPLRYRACFQTELSLAMLSETYLPYDEAAPLTAPGWFSCFDAEEIGAAIKAGTALAFLSRSNEPYGFDRIIAVTETGAGYAWPQLNDCGDAAFGGDPLPPGCPPAP